MDQFLRSTRRLFLDSVARSLEPFHGRLILLTHLLPDRPELLDSFSCIAPIELILAVPYSTNPEVLKALRASYKIITPTLDQLNDAGFLSSVVVDHAANDEIVIVEIGGYFANALPKLTRALGNRLVGVVEDTEHGHRKYEGVDLPCPVVSVARSTLKEAEDLVVGPSCVFSTEKLLRSAGYLLEAKRSLVIGFGHVGKGVARALSGRRSAVTVYDLNTIRRAVALSSGYSVPNRASALQTADLIFGATGCESIGATDFELLRNGVVLVSCSSKDVEFDVEFLRTNYNRKTVREGIECFQKADKSIYLLTQGYPVNFVDGAVMGPVLSLVQAELLIAIEYAVHNRANKEIMEVPNQRRRKLAEKWMEAFSDSDSGSFRFT